MSEQPGVLLSDRTDFQVRAKGPKKRAVQQIESVHTDPPGRPCLMIAGDAAVVFEVDLREVDGGAREEGPWELLVTFGVQADVLAREKLEVVVTFHEQGSRRSVELLRERLDPFQAKRPWYERRLSLADLEGSRGQLSVACERRGEQAPGPGRLGKLKLWLKGIELVTGRLALYELVVSPRGSLSLNRARAFAGLRERNELRIFSASYEHALFQEGGERPLHAHWKQRLKRLRAAWRERRRRRREEATLPAVALPPTVQVEPQPERTDRVPVAEPSPEPAPAPEPPRIDPATTNVYAYYTARLSQLEREAIPDFTQRLLRRLERIEDRPLRILSLASGAARIEEGILQGLPPERIELTLTDLNEDLLRQAASRFTGLAGLRTKRLNLNQARLPAEHYDVILCVSALHHVVELEALLQEVRQALVCSPEPGEFWSIGEYIGRNGSRLHEEAYLVANEVFRSLPSAYRVNRNPGSEGEVHEDLPNSDCSVTCFEGIRSEEIEGLLERRFRPIQRHRIDCFLWRLFNLAYFDNYDLSRSEDRELVERALSAEIDFRSQGGQPTALWGVYRPR